MHFGFFKARQTIAGAALIAMAIGAGIGHAQNSSRRERGPQTSRLFSQSGLTLWFNAAQAQVADNRVTKWMDASGSGAHADQPDIARQPLFLSDGVHSQPALRFDGIDDEMPFSLGLDRLPGATIFVVSAPVAGENARAAVAWNGEQPSTLHVSPGSESLAYSFGAEARMPIGQSGFYIATTLKSEGREAAYRNGRMLHRASGRVAYLDLPAQQARVGAGESHFHGDIAEILIFTRALDDEERSSVERYLSGKYGIPLTEGGLPIANAGFSRAATVGETLVLNGAAPDDAHSSLTWTAEGPGSVMFGDEHAAYTTAQFSEPGEYVLRLTLRNSDGITSDEIRVLATHRDDHAPAVSTGRAAGTTESGKAAHWSMEEGAGTNTTDSSGSGNHARIEFGAAWVAGKVGNTALNFDGVDDRVIVPQTSFQGTGDFSWTAWVKPSAGIYRGYLFDLLRGQEHIHARIEQAGGVAKLCYGNGNNGILCAPSLTPYLNQWVHVAVTRPSGGANAKLFVNGARVVSGFVGADPGAATQLALGGMADMPGTLAYKGAMDDVRFYRRVLSEGEVTEIVNEGNQVNHSGSPADTAAPGVAITSPAHGSQVSGTVTVTATATDNVGVSRIDFSVNGSYRFSDSTPPYNFVWVPDAPGSYLIRAMAYDAAGNSATHQVTVQYGASIPTPPPSGGSTGTGSLVISGGSPSGNLAAGTQAVTLRVSTSAWAFCKFTNIPGSNFADSVPFMNTYGTSHSTDISHVRDGQTFRYYIRCRDQAGAVTPEYSITFSIGSGGSAPTAPPPPPPSGGTQDTIAPSVSISSPSNGASVNGTVTVNIAATDNVAMAKVELLVDGVVRDSKQGAPYTFSWDSSTVLAGSHTLQARAYDAAGNTAAHQVSVTVTAPPSTGGRQFYISTTGNDSNPGTIAQPWRTMLKAVNTMIAGDTTFVRGGVYDKALSIGVGNGAGARNGAPGAPITLRAYPGESVVWRNDPSYPVDSGGRQGFIDFRERSYWVIEGFTFENVGPASGVSGWWTYGIQAWGPAKSIQIRNNTFDGKGILRKGGMVIDVRYGFDDAVIENNRIVNFPSFSDLMGVMIESNFRSVGKESAVVVNRNTVVRGNFMQGMGGDCIQIGEWGGYNTLIENNTCAMTYNDSVNGTSEEFLDIKKSWLTTVRGNVAYGSRPKTSSPGGGAIVVHMNAVDVLIERNTFYDNGQGIGLGSGARSNFPAWYSGDLALQRVTIRHNLFYDTNTKAAYNGLQSYGNPIFASGVNGLKIYNNTIAYSAGSAIELESNTGVEISNNVFYRNAYREIWEKTWNGTNWNQTKIGANFFDDQHAGYSISYRKPDNSFFNGTAAAFQLATLQGVGSRQGDPQLINPTTSPSTANYRPQSGSPLIDAGGFLLNEVFEFLGSRPDMGAFEYGQ